MIGVEFNVVTLVNAYHSHDFTFTKKNMILNGE